MFPGRRCERASQANAHATEKPGMEIGFRDRTVGGGSVWDPGRPDLDDQTINTIEISSNY